MLTVLKTYTEQCINTFYLKAMFSTNENYVILKPLWLCDFYMTLINMIICLFYFNTYTYTKNNLSIIKIYLYIKHKPFYFNI